MKRHTTLARYFGCALLTLSVQGCVTWVDVEKFKQPAPDPRTPSEVPSSSQKGFRYSMPEPYLLVKPKADGTATYEWVFLPDRNNEYVVAPKSLFATYKMTVATENGFLTSASFDGTANEVASKLASVVGDVNAANKTSESAAQKAIEQAAQTKAAADETAFNTKLAAAQKAVADAEATQTSAEAELKFYESDAGKGAKDEVKLAAQLAKQKADATLALMNKRLQDLLVSSSGAKDAGAAEPGIKHAMGPVLFKLVQTANSVSLVQVDIQRTFETSGTPAKETSPPAGAAPTLTAKNVSNTAGTTVVDFSASAAIEIVNDALLTLNKGMSPTTSPRLSTRREPGTNSTRPPSSPRCLRANTRCWSCTTRTSRRSWSSPSSDLLRSKAWGRQRGVRRAGSSGQLRRQAHRARVGRCHPVAAFSTIHSAAGCCARAARDPATSASGAGTGSWQHHAASGAEHRAVVRT